MVEEAIPTEEMSMVDSSADVDIIDILVEHAIQLIATDISGTHVRA
jgi:hypothetical protein